MGTTSTQCDSTPHTWHGTPVKTEVVMRTDLRHNDVWFVYNGWHFVWTVENNAPGNNANQTRTSVEIQAMSDADGKYAWGRRKWETGLRSDLAEKDECLIWNREWVTGATEDDVQGDQQ